MSYKLCGRGVIARWSLIRELLVQIESHIYGFEAPFTVD